MMVAALAVNSRGELYGICEDGVLYRFDTATAEMTRIGDTGVKVASYRGVVQQTGEFDQHTDIFYWASHDAYGQALLYTVDVNDASVSLIGEIPGHAELLNMQFLAPRAADKAPNFITGLTTDYADGNLSGTVSFTVPTDTYDGTAMSGTLTYSIAVNGETKITGSTTPGAVIQKEVEVSQGNALFEVYVENNVGKSPAATAEFWAGQDTPVMKEVKYTASARNSTITWSIADKGVHGGFIGDVTYNVTRLPDNHTVVTGTRETTVTDVIPDDAPLAKYEYVVTPVNAGLEGSPMTSNGNVVGSAVVPPYYQSFDDESSFETMKVIDSNKDGLTWKWGEQSMFNPQGVAICDPGYSDFDVDFDDWLLTPLVKLEAGKSYKVSFKVMGTCWDSDYIEVLYGTGDDVSKYKSILPKTEITFTNKFQEYSAVITSDKAQEIRIGFHHTAEYADGSMKIDDIIISAPTTMSSPAECTDLEVIPHPTGELEATVRFTTPSVDKQGNQLSSITKAEISCDGIVVKTIENPEVGSVQEAKINVTGNGTHTFSVETQNAEGSSEAVSVSKFVGVDAPGNFSVYLDDNGDNIRLHWTPCTTGKDGNYVNPDKIVYDVYQLNGNLVGDLIMSDLTGTEVQIPFDCDKGQMGMVQLAMRARNEAGESRANSSNALIVGAPYTMPIEEHFDGNSRYLYEGDTDINFDFAEGASSDGDNCSFAWMIYGNKNPYKDLRTLKIKVDGGNPRLSFDYLIPEGGKMEIYAITPDRNMNLLTTLEYNPAEKSWNNCTLGLSGYTDLRYIRIAWRFVAENIAYGAMMLDNIHLLDAPENDMEVTSVTVPANGVKYGQHANIDVMVTNRGINTCGDYTLSLYAGDVKVDEQSGSGLGFLKTRTHNFTYEIVPGTPEAVKIRAELTYTDENADNNTAASTLTVKTPKVSAPEKLTGESVAGGIKLNWDAPTEFYTEKILEDFESYSPWTISNFGDWTVYDLDEAPVIELGEADFPNEGRPQAFTIFNPSSIGVPDGNTEAVPHSGLQYLACFAADIYEADGNDDWIISPILPGKAQTISFYAKQMITSYGAEKLQVLYSNDGNEPEDFELIEEFTIDNAAAWTRFTAELPDGALYFALRVVTSDGHLCMIDDISFTAGSCTEILSWNVYCNGKFLAEVPFEQLEYTDAAGTEGNFYNVTANYATGEESAFSNTFSIGAGVNGIFGNGTELYDVFTIDGKILQLKSESIDDLEPGVYVINGRKVIIRR